MNRRFVVLIDFSEYSTNLLKYAYDWSVRVGSRLLLVHQTVVLAPALADINARKSIAQHANNEAIQKLKELTDSVLPKDAKFSSLVSENELTSTLKELLTEYYEDLVFVGLKGTGVLKKIFIGSVALRIIENIDNIVVAIPKNITSFSHKKIFVGVTEMHPLNIVELNKVLGFIDKEVAVITFFYLANPDEQTESIKIKLEGLTKLLSDKYNTNFSIYRGETSFAGIKNVISNGTDEILIIQKGSRFLSDQLFRKLLINELVYDAQTPLIILP